MSLTRQHMSREKSNFFKRWCMIPYLLFSWVLIILFWIIKLYYRLSSTDKDEKFHSPYLKVPLENVFRHATPFWFRNRGKLHRVYVTENRTNLFDNNHADGRRYPLSRMNSALEEKDLFSRARWDLKLEQKLYWKYKGGIPKEMGAVRNIFSNRKSTQRREPLRMAAETASTKYGKREINLQRLPAVEVTFTRVITCYSRSTILSGKEHSRLQSPRYFWSASNIETFGCTHFFKYA